MSGFLKFQLNIRQEFGEGQAETPGDQKRRLDGEVVLAAFDAAHVGAMQVAMVSEGFLGEPFFPPQFPYAVPENHR